MLKASLALAVLVIGWGGLCLPAAASCNPAAGPPPTLLSATTTLRQAGARHEDMDTDVSAVERTALKAFKQALADAVDERMACAAPDMEAHALEGDLARALAGAHAKEPAAAGDDDPPFGARLQVDVTGGPARPRLMLVLLGFTIPCGDDNLLLGYRLEHSRWKRVLRWQSDDYDSISGAFGGPFSAVALPDGHVAVAHGTPWCTSNWSKFGLDLLRPPEGDRSQQVLYHLEHGYRSDEPLALAARPDGFELRAEVGMLDTDVLARQGIFRYRVTGDKVERIQPAARNGRDFVDEWLQVDEPLARVWSAPAAASRIITARSALLKEKPSPIYGAVRACKSRPGQYQVEINLSDSGSDLHRYALLRQEPNGFTMLGFGDKEDPACAGANLMAP